MKEKLTDNIEDYDEDIPSRDTWKRYDVRTIKGMFSDWIDHNIEYEYQSYPEFFIKDNEKRFYMMVTEQGYTDEEPDEEEYYCVVTPFDTKRVEKS